MIFDPNWYILDKIGSNSSFTKSLGLIIDSSRSGTCFSSCLASSIDFSKTKKCLFLGGQLWWTQQFISLQPISGPCGIEIMYPREWRIAIPASLMRVDDIGCLNEWCKESLDSHLKLLPFATANIRKQDHFSSHSTVCSIGTFCSECHIILLTRVRCGKCHAWKLPKAPFWNP